MRSYPKVLLGLATALLGGGIAFTTPSAATAVTMEVECAPATYRASDDATGWDVCATDGHWVRAGDCPPGTVAKFFAPALSPYCVPPDWQPPGQ